ncbi:UNVERIFIED_CONTAM: hypothetical protein Sradi_3860800 [Sesamum radiatum]|uniref:Uncharacterized protein n=1 Tax=Sesamum radiatum TaxID=300843 RepID=A0AAW2Q2F3_SESRA
MVEITNTRQWKDERVIDYINRWRALSLNYRDKLSEALAIEMCIQDMHWGHVYILQGIKLRNFEELATRAHNMDLSIANRPPKQKVKGRRFQRPCCQGIDDSYQISSKREKKSKVSKPTYVIL